MDDLLDGVIEFKNRDRILFKWANAISSKIILALYKKNIEREYSKTFDAFLNSGERVTISIINEAHCNQFHSLLTGGFSSKAQGYLQLSGISKERAFSLMKQRTHVMFGVYQRNDLIAYGMAKVFLWKTSFVSFGVKDSWRNKGVATTLIKHMVSSINERGFKIYALLDIENTLSYNLLLKNGFVNIRKTKKFFLLKASDAE